MVAAILTKNPAPGYKNGLEVREYTAPEPKDGEAVIRIQAAALNHRFVLFRVLVANQ